MLQIGDRVWVNDELLGDVERQDGDEAVIIRKPNGRTERWHRYADEQSYMTGLLRKEARG